ncbi:unnamed protein product [Linum trigynum]|uniref:Uncharacterized protein n=1 Tax=Linum trigynum TaxID=586398 RepID=A0AAV2E7Y5_9ROSI
MVAGWRQRMARRLADWRVARRLEALPAMACWRLCSGQRWPTMSLRISPVTRGRGGGRKTRGMSLAAIDD